MIGELFDSHCHLDDEQFAGDLPQTLERMRQARVTRALVAASDRASSRRVAALAQAHNELYGAVGVHPEEVDDYGEDALPELSELLTLPKIVAVGEIGLDYHYENTQKAKQQAAFEAQLDLAVSADRPVVIHIRDAHGDAMELLRARRNRLPDGVMHCFSGSVEVARAYLDMGFYLSFAGPITYKNANKLLEVAPFCPADRLLVETDSPYLAPVPMRGRRNEPAFVAHTVQRVAELRGVSPAALADLTTANAMRLFRIEG